VVVCLERGADLHMAQLMPLPLTVSCSSKIQVGFTFLVPAHLGSPGKHTHTHPFNGPFWVVLEKRPLNGCSVVVVIAWILNIENVQFVLLRSISITCICYSQHNSNAN